MANKPRGYLESRTCSVCSKEFVPGAKHQYRTKGKNLAIQCSYTCWCKAKDAQRAIIQH